MRLFMADVEFDVVLVDCYCWIADPGRWLNEILINTNVWHDFEAAKQKAIFTHLLQVVN